MRFLRWCAFLLLGGLLAVAALYVAIGAHGSAEVSAAKRQALQDVALGLPDGMRQASEDRDRVRRAGDRWGRPAYSWQELICALNHSEAGLLVQEYYQECRVRSVDLIASGEPVSGLCLSRELPAPVGELGPQSSFSVHVTSSEALTSPDPIETSCPDGALVTPLSGESRLLTGTRPGRLDPTTAWTIVVVDTPVSHSTLGCSPWALLFCSEPVDQPVMPDSPESGTRATPPASARRR